MTIEPVRPRRDDPALLYSLAEFREIIFAAFEEASVATVVEVGAEAGGFTGELVDWVRAHDGRLTTIDPVPSDAVREFVARSGEAAVLVEDLSVNALPGLAVSDAYLLDGDHNYFTVSRELESIDAAAGAAGSYPLVVLQDASWPAGQRDQYYDPASLPADAVHPYSYGGVLPWSTGTGSWGFRGGSAFAFARTEGGARNGVGTAIEDFLAEHSGYRRLFIPCIFGLVLLYHGDAPWADRLTTRLAPLDDHPLLRRLEANRMWLYLRVIELQDRLDQTARLADARAVTGEAEAARLRAELALAGQQIRDLTAPHQAGAVG